MQAPYFTYTGADGKPYIAFYEDAQSWRAKLDNVIAPGAGSEAPVGGMAEWALGYEDPRAWEAVHAALQPVYRITGPIGLCYTRYGGGARFGLPLGDEQDSGPAMAGTLNGRAGREQRFEHGTIYYRWGAARAYFDGEPL